MNAAYPRGQGGKLQDTVTEMRGRDELQFERSPPGTGNWGYPHDGMTLRTLFDILRRRRRLIGWIVLGGMIGAAGLALFLPVRYTAKAQVIVEGTQVPPGSAETGPDQASIQTQVTALSSHDLLAGVVVQLAADPAFRAIQYSWAGSIPVLAVTSNRMLAVHRLKKHLHVFQERGSDVVSIAYTSRDPVAAATIANKIAAYYLATGDDQSRLAMNQALTALAAKLAELRSESASRDAAVAAYQASHGVHAYGSNITDHEVADLNAQLSRAQAELAARRTRYSALSALRGPRGDWSRLLSGAGTQGLVDLHEQAAAVLQGRQTSIFFSPDAAAAAGGQAAPALMPLRDKVERELDRALLKLSNDERVAVAQVDAIERRLGAVQRASHDVRLHGLVVAAVGARQRYDRLLQRRNQLLERADDVNAPARLLSWAHIPLRPSSLNPLLFTAPALVAFLVLGGLAALWRDHAEQGIYSDADVESALGVRCAGSVLMSPCIPGGETARTSFAGALQELRGIMVSLRLIGQGRKSAQVVLVTSATSDEGKTTLVRMLATCEAATGARVLLLDCDERAGAGVVPLAAPRSVVERKGTRYARTRSHDAELIPVRRAVGLDYLRIRQGPAAEPSPLFSIEQMSALLQGYRSDYDLILIDGAAVLSNAEVRLLAAVADQILVAVRWGATRRDNARTALTLLRGCGPDGTETAATISVAIIRLDPKRMSGAPQEQQSWPKQPSVSA